MNATSLFGGPRPNTYAWATAYGILMSTAIGGYAAATAGPQLPTTVVGIAGLGVELLIRALVLGELMRVLLSIKHRPNTKTRFFTALSILACGSMLLTLHLNPGPITSLGNALVIGVWWLAHCRISAQLDDVNAMNETLSQLQLRAAIIGSRPQPEWMQELRAKLESDPDYRDSH